jgi:glycosyltransferase involved in cell wall biosynthesis
VLRQTYEELEIILVDDGSPDACGGMCDEYAARDVRIVVVHKQNGGLSSARNAGLDACAGDFITFIDSDDWVSDDYIESLFLAMDGLTDISICGHKKVFRGQDAPAKRSPIGQISSYTGRQALDMLLGDGLSIMPVTSCGKLYRRGVFEGVRFPEGRIHEDDSTTYRLFYNSSKVAYFGAENYYYFQNDNGIMRGGAYGQGSEHTLLAYVEMVDFFEKAKEPAYAMMARKHLFWFFARIPQGADVCEGIGYAAKKAIRPLLHADCSTAYKLAVLAVLTFSFVRLK